MNPTEMIDPMEIGSGGHGMELSHTAAREGKLLSFLRRELGLSYGLVKRLKYRHAYRVNGVAARTNHPVRAGDVITVALDEEAPAIGAEDAALSILYEDASLLVLDKPSGILAHPSFHRAEGTLANALAGYYRRSGQPCAVHLVSRLDRDTFGAVLVAKNAHIHAVLCGHMQAGRIRKTYRAAVYGRPEADCGEIGHPIARRSPTSLLRCVREDGKPARTVFTVLRGAGECSLLELVPETGRTHQLRVHCAREGFPILGDAQYGTEASQAFSLSRGIGSQQLCAASLVFPHPVSGENVAVASRQSVCLPDGEI